MRTMPRRASHVHAIRSAPVAELVAGLVAGLALFTVPAWADPAALIARLDSVFLADREGAMLELFADPSFDLETIEHWLALPELTPEQRLRLEVLGRERFASTPRAGLGVRFANLPTDEGVRLDGVLPGFPAGELLRPGDIVLSINGQPVLNTAHMGEVILSHVPGESLVLDIARPVLPMPRAIGPDGVEIRPPVEHLTIAVPLGRYDDLQTGIALTPPRLEGAFRQRLARIGALISPGEIGAGLTPLEWLHREGYDEARAIAPLSQLHPVMAWRSVSFGGQPASWIAGIEVRRGDQNAMMRRANIAIQADGVYDRVEEALSGYRALVRRLAELRIELNRATDNPDDRAAQAALRLERIRDEQALLERGIGELVEFFTADAPVGDPP